MGGSAGGVSMWIVAAVIAVLYILYAAAVTVAEKIRKHKKKKDV